MNSVLVNLDGRQVNVVIESGGLGAAMAVSLAEVSADVSRAETAADEAEASAMEAAAAVAGVPAQLAGKVDYTALAASGGSALVGFLQAGTGAVARTAQSKMRDVISVKDFGAVADLVLDANRQFVSGTDNYASIQAALDAAKAAGRARVVVPPGEYLCNGVLTMDYGVELKGGGRQSTRIVKNSTTTKAVTISSTAMAGGYNGTLPSNINAMLVLTGDNTGGRYVGGISDITLQGTYSTFSDKESQKVEFGIVGAGDFSDYYCHRVDVERVQYGHIYWSIFLSSIEDCRIESCLSGLFISSGTSTHLARVYANNCRDYGIWDRGMIYGSVTDCAVDYLNRPDFYPDRSRLTQCYVFASTRNFLATANGIEQSYGRGYVFDDFGRGSVAISNSAIGIGSDYTGAEEIAFVYVATACRGGVIGPNFGYVEKAGGWIQGGANPAKHHNVYVVPGTILGGEKISGNLVSDAGNSNIETGYGNNVPTTWPNIATTGEEFVQFSPTFGAETTGNLSVTYNAGNKHYYSRDGKFLDVWGTFDVTISHTTASGRIFWFGMPANNAPGLNALGVLGSEGSPVAQAGHFVLGDSGGTTAIGRTSAGASLLITDYPSGTYQIFYRGRYPS